MTSKIRTSEQNGGADVAAQNNNKRSTHRKLFKSPKINYFLEQFSYDRNKSSIENERARAMNDRRFQYYNEIKEREHKS